MDKDKIARLEAEGWKIGNADDFLELNREESELLDLKIAFGQRLTEIRKRQNVTQIQLAEKIKSSQSRVSKMEKGDPSVSMDLLIRSLLVLGDTKENFIPKAVH